MEDSHTPNLTELLNVEFEVPELPEAMIELARQYAPNRRDFVLIKDNDVDSIA